MSSIYVHIPFCKSRCIYCDFYSTTFSDIKDRYIDAVLKELSMRMTTDFHSPDTIYIGGGTPSVLSVRQLSHLIDGITSLADCTHITERTIECNPDDVTEELAAWLASAPVNRVSMGVQTFSDNRLQWLRRRHSSQQAKDAVRTLRIAGIKNISIDLMFGFPQQTIGEWLTDIDEAVRLKPEHISAYSLMYEEGTVLHRLLENGEVEEIDEELALEMYDRLIDRLAEAGYMQYEISNFSLPSFRSRHNSSYWHDVPYLGIGAAAHSYDRRRRWWNISDVKRYMAAVEAGQPETESEEIDDATHYNDIVTTALRTRDGILLSTLKPDFRDYILRQAEPHLQASRMTVEKGRLHLTRRGLFTSDDIMSDLIY